MALAETANLIVALKLDDRLSGPLRGISGRLGRLNVDTGLLNQGLGKVGRGLGVGLRNSLIIGTAALGAISTQILAGVASLRELEDVNAQTEAAIESTGGAAGLTAKDIRDLAEEYEELGGVIDDKVIQSAQNVLLTFTDIRKEAFEPALEAALNLSTRLGTDLNSASIQVGKALQDPVRGLTALRRVGVNFTDDQEKLIRALVEENDLYGAQQLILAELEEEFGGSFAARGQTQEATIGRMKDAIEGLQQSLATAFIPVIDKVARKLTTLFNDPATIRGVKEFGDRLAGFFTDERLDAAGDAVKGLFGYLASVPWGTIGSGLKIAGDAAKIVIDAFNALPKEVQGIVITALAANKLTGGLVASGIGDIGKALTGNFFARGSSPANPLFVSAVGGLGGVGGAGAGGRSGGGFLGGVAKFVLGPAAAVIIGAEIAAEINRPVIAPALEFEKEQFTAVLDSQDADKLVEGLSTLNTTFEDADFPETAALLLSHLPFIGDALGHIGPVMDEQKDAIIKQLEGMGYTREQIDGMLYKLDQQREQDLGFDGRIGTTIEKQLVTENNLLVEAKQNRATLGTKLDVVPLRIDTMRDTVADRLINLDTNLGAKSDVVSSRVLAMRDTMASKLDTANADLGTIAGKDFSTTVKLDQTVNVSATLSAAQAQTAIQIHNTITQQANKGNVP